MDNSIKTTVIAVSNQKGGVGKTSTSISFAAALAIRGYKVLAIDMDPQGNLSTGSGADTSDEAFTILEVLKGGVPVAEAIQHLSAFDIIPADISLAGYEQELISSTFGRDSRLKEGIASLKGLYDFIIVDTAPSLAMLTINALVAADEVLVPATAEFFATTGLEQLSDTVRNVRKYAGNPDLKFAGILFTLYDERTVNGRTIRGLTKEYAQSIGTDVFDTFIRKAVAMGESQTNRKNIFVYSPKSTVAMDYMAFTDEYLTRHANG